MWGNLMNKNIDEFAVFLRHKPKANGERYSEKYVQNIVYLIKRLPKDFDDFSVLNEFIKIEGWHPPMVRALSSYLQWLLYGEISKKNSMLINASLYIPPKKPPRYSHYEKVLTRDEMMLLIKMSPNLMWRLVFRMLYDTLLRREEFVNIRLKDVDMAKKEVLVKIKGQAERDMAKLSGNTISDLKAYVVKYNIKKGYLFPFFHTVKNPGYKLWYEVNKECIKILGKRFNPHWFRHSSAQHAADLGAQEKALMALGRWKSKGVLDIYSKHSRKSKEKAFKDFHEPI